MAGEAETLAPWYKPNWLRDYHHMLWLGKALFHVKEPRDLEYQGMLSYNEYRELESHVRLLWLVRNHLHYLSGRKNDRLGFEHQEKIATRLGFEDEAGLLAVENFLGRLHASMASIKSLHQSFMFTHTPRGHKSRTNLGSSDTPEGLHLYKGELNFDSPTLLLSHPLLMMDIFEQSARLGLPLSQEARRLVREFLSLACHTLYGSQQAFQRFLSIMNSPNTTPVLEQMLETGFLDMFLPEFGRIKNRVQFDSYHIYPVGSHLLQTVANLKSIPKAREIVFADILFEVSNPEILYLAGLFHDIGKTGKDHSTRGADIARNILARFNYQKTRSEEVTFLIRYHLFLAETATSRDLNEEKIVVQCARTIESTDRLKMLYLLTWGDSCATGPRAWNDWIANLVQELFFKILNILERGELASTDASRTVEEAKSLVREALSARIQDSELEGFLDLMSPRYLLDTKPRDIIRHIQMVQDFKMSLKTGDSTPLVLEAIERLTEGCWELTCIAKDRPGLFSDMAGVLALNNIQILSARIYTWRDSTAVDVFKVTPPLDPLRTQEIWDNVEKDFLDTSKGKLCLDLRLQQKHTHRALPKRSKGPSRPARISFDNGSSDFFTIVQVIADDREGLLYTITHTLFEMRLDIKIAKISTKGNQAADTFYVRDLEGQKVEDGVQVKEIKEALLHRLAHQSV